MSDDDLFFSPFFLSFVGLFIKKLYFSFLFKNQEFVDTYGVPRYKEANPALFTAASFPFLYGIMYGDIGHGTVIFFLGLYLIFSYAGVAGRRDMGELAGGL